MGAGSVFPGSGRKPAAGVPEPPLFLLVSIDVSPGSA